MDSSDKISLIIAALGAVIAALSVVSSALAAGGLTASVGISAVIAGLTYYEAHVTRPPTPPVAP
jgi:hypothetical protein